MIGLIAFQPVDGFEISLLPVSDNLLGAHVANIVGAGWMAETGEAVLKSWLELRVVTWETFGIVYIGV